VLSFQTVAIFLLLDITAVLSSFPICSYILGSGYWYCTIPGCIKGLKH